MSPYTLLARVVLLARVLLGGLLGRLWEKHEQRDVEEKWHERERMLDRRKAVASRHEVLRRHSRPRWSRPGRSPTYVAGYPTLRARRSGEVRRSHEAP